MAQGPALPTSMTRTRRSSVPRPATPCAALPADHQPWRDQPRLPPSPRGLIRWPPREDRYVPLASCDYFVDLRLPGGDEAWAPWSEQEDCQVASASDASCPLAGNPRGSSGEWEVVACFPFLDAGATPLLSRVLLLPTPLIALLEPLRRVPALVPVWNKLDAATDRVQASYTVLRRRPEAQK